MNELYAGSRRVCLMQLNIDEAPLPLRVEAHAQDIAWPGLQLCPITKQGTSNRPDLPKKLGFAKVSVMNINCMQESCTSAQVDQASLYRVSPLVTAMYQKQAVNCASWVSSSCC